MRFPRWRDLRRPAPVLATIVVFLLVVALAFRAWDAYVEDGLSRWVVDETARRTGGTYRLSLGDLSFLPLAGSIAFDSAAITTDSARNRSRPEPLPVLRGRAHECRVSGLALLRLLFGQSFSARVLECGRVAASIRLAARGPDEPVSAVDTTSGSAGAEVVRPLGLSSFRIARVSLPSLSLRLERPGPRGGTTLVLEHARFDAEGIDFDLERATADRARLRATGLVLRPDSLTEISVARLDAGLTDSTLALSGAEHEPAIPEAEWVRRVRV
ncbi:MAG TPA: hypothetical protein VHG35_18000, partial [Gemmatimonadales bacterium]|nr:hypothetical protein [Gemmatimonadales bacterium]